MTAAVPAVAMSGAGTAAINCVALTNVVVRATPFHCTTAPVTKPEPLTVSVNAALPAIAVVCPSDPRTGTGLLIVNVSGLEVPPPGSGFTTVTAAVPPVVRSPIGTTAVS